MGLLSNTSQFVQLMNGYRSAVRRQNLSGVSRRQCPGNEREFAGGVMVSRYRARNDDKPFYPQQGATVRP